MTSQSTKHTSKRQHMPYSLVSSLPKSTMNVLLLLLCLFLIFSKTFVSGDYPPYQYCPDTNNNNSTHTTDFNKNVDTLLVSLSSSASHLKFHSMSFGSAKNRSYGLYLCLRYLTPQACKTCVTVTMATQAITKLCPNSSDATVWEDVCQLRVSDQRFFGHLDLTGDISKYNTKTISEPEKFRSVVNSSLFSLAEQAAFNSSARMYATKLVPFLSTEKVYSLVQCTLDLSPNDCLRCLKNAIVEVLGSGKYQFRGGRLLSKSCYLRYEFYAFYDGKTSEDPVAQTNNKWRKWIIPVLAVVAASVAAVLVGSCVFYFFNRDKTLDFEVKDSHFFDLTSIHEATDNFSDKVMLGEGGFGPVFKGTLQDGTTVAVKRLSNASDQGTEEFKNEVLLIMKLQHKNLVKLLGFCVEGAERLLVYEFMPEGGLDSFLYDSEKRAQLTWINRLQILDGIARGILYLHEDSRLRIIHRDLKPSNVLLDSDLNPKISDFGNARIYGGNDSEASTVIVIGTYGYMAPEYAMEGIYSVKSDVYSFGIILLEMITGIKSLGFHLCGKGPSLQAYAWNLWVQGRALELIDPVMNDSDSLDIDQFLRCLHIGLLCVQEDASDRPIISLVIQMLKTKSIDDLHTPKHPAFSVGSFDDHYEASPRTSTSVQCFTASYLATP